MKKKILFTTDDMKIGGIEKALVNLLNNLDYDKYEVHLLLQHKEGDLLELLNPQIIVDDYHLSKMRFWPLRKVINLIKQIRLGMKIKNKYAFSACFGTGYIPSSRMALLASHNNACWMHTNILNFIANTSWYMKKGRTNEERARIFLKKISFEKFKHRIFVSQNALDTYLSLDKNSKNNILCHNYVDGKDIIKKSEEQVDDMYEKKGTTFINVSRYTEFDKKITRIILAAAKLRNEKYKFQIIMIGDGEDRVNYEKLIKEAALDDVIIFLGKRLNPFPYLKNADCFLLSSQYEGFPTTFTESLTLNIPIITTDVSDAKSFIDGKYGIVVNNDDDDIYNGMKKYLDYGFKIKKKFDYQAFNQDSLDRLYEIIEEER